MFTTLILLACLHGDPAQCREFPAELPEDAGMSACSVFGQQVAAAWQAVHPAYTIAAIRCRFGPPERAS